ncbi:MAG TPA: hypothetical protein VHO29_15325 [Marmoricola sp.]|nr:hypothetical protein [Marmoricola sp.]
MIAMNENSIRAIWEAELDRLELDVLRVERILKGLGALPTEPWTPPAIPGQMPADLLGRAQALLDRQEQVTAELGNALVSAQKQIAFGDRVTNATGQGPARPVYLDLEA